MYGLFDNFLNSPSLIVKLCERGKYGIGTARKDRKEMPEIPVDRQVKRDDFEFLYSDKVACCKWLDRRSVTMLFSNVEGMVTTSTVPPPPCKKDQRLISCPDIIKMYNKGMGGGVLT